MVEEELDPGKARFAGSGGINVYDDANRCERRPSQEKNRENMTNGNSPDIPSGNSPGIHAGVNRSMPRANTRPVHGSSRSWRLGHPNHYDPSRRLFRRAAIGGSSLEEKSRKRDS